MRKPIILSILIITSTFHLMGQRIKNLDYRLLLSGLLAHSVNEISVEQADSMKSTALFVDSREYKEYEVSHIDKAISVGYDQLDLSALNHIDKQEEIIVYCSVGYRSEKVAKKLHEMGFKNVYNLYGGIFEWKNQGKEVVNMKNEVTDSVHAYNKIWGIWLRKGEKVY